MEKAIHEAKRNHSEKDALKIAHALQSEFRYKYDDDDDDSDLFNDFVATGFKGPPGLVDDSGRTSMFNRLGGRSRRRRNKKYSKRRGKNNKKRKTSRKRIKSRRKRNRKKRDQN